MSYWKEFKETAIFPFVEIRDAADRGEPGTVLACVFFILVSPVMIPVFALMFSMAAIASFLGKYLCAILKRKSD